MMKLIVRIMHLVIAAIAAVATILLFAMPALSFNSKVVLDVEAVSNIVPSTEFTKDINFVEVLGTDEIQAGINFKLSATDINKVMNGDRDVINEKVLVKNMDDTLQTLDDGIEVLADYTIRTNLTGIVKQELIKQVENAKPEDKTTEEVIDYLGLGDPEYKEFAYSLYDTANKSDANVDSVGQVLLEHIDEILVKVEKMTGSKSGTFTDEQKEDAKNNMKDMLKQIKILKDDDYSLHPISDLPYLYAIDFVKEKLNSKVSADKLAIKAGETNREYSNRMLETYVVTEMPEIVYQIVGYVSLGLFIGMFVIAGTWILLAAFEVLHFFFVNKKHRLFKGLFMPFFILAGLIQIVLGFVLTGAVKYILPEKIDISKLNLPIKSAVIVPRTCTLATSIVFIIAIGAMIALCILKIFVPKEKKDKED